MVDRGPIQLVGGDGEFKSVFIILQSSAFFSVDNTFALSMKLPTLETSFPLP
jgi:hypothetical protein